MEYDWNNILVPGSVVCASIGDFNGNKKIGLFLVLYDERSDNDIMDNQNVVALKLTTQNTCSNYVLQISSKSNSFLDKDCIVCCSKLHTLHKVSNIYKVLGVVSPNTLKRVYRVYKKFENKMNDQILNNI